MGSPLGKMKTSNTSAESEAEETRLDTVESRMSAMEQVLNKAVERMLPKVDALLTQVIHEEETFMESSTSKDVSSSNKSTQSTLVLELAEKGDYKAILELVEDLDVDFHKNPQRNERGDTALHVAAKGGHLKAVVMLLGLGANINSCGNRLRTPLHCAVAQGHLKVARHLVIAGAKADIVDVDGATPLGIAAGQANRDCVNMLLQSRTSPDEMAFFIAAEHGHWEIVELLLQKGGVFVPFWTNKEKDPLIVLACKANKWEMVKRFLEKGASATKCKTDRESALVWATLAGQDGVVRDLLRHGASSHFEQMRWALMNAKSTAVVWAFVNVVPHIIRGELGELGLVAAGSHDRKEALLAFLEAGVNVNTKDRVGVPVLSRATCHGNIACVKLLLQSGAKVNIKDDSGDTPLHVAASKGQVECLRALLQAGARTSETNNMGKTPLKVAKTFEVQRILTVRL